MSRMDFFPIMTTSADLVLLKGKVWFLVMGIPWTMIRPHEEQAKQNHGGQGLEKLAARGGLCIYEALNVLDGKTWGHNRQQTPIQMHEDLHARVLAFQAAP